MDRYTLGEKIIYIYKSIRLQKKKKLKLLLVEIFLTCFYSRFIEKIKIIIIL